MGLRPAWIQTSLRIRSDAKAGLHHCWSGTHYVGFVMTRLIYKIDTICYCFCFSPYFFYQCSIYLLFHSDETSLVL
jgi:hypothetical protein